MADPIETEDFEVIICGCGPTGALLSANLSWLGVKHVIIEKDTAITTDPRGIALDEDGIRLVQGVGKYKELFTDVGTGSERPFVVSEFPILTIYLAMGFFRFIDGGRGLHVKPFLQINNNTVRWAYDIGNIALMFNRLPAEQVTPVLFHTSNLHLRSICEMQSIKTSGSLEQGVRSRQSMRIIVLYMLNIKHQAEPSLVYEVSFWLELTARPASPGKCTWNRKEL
jgi:hypothetical protein